jgi:hypothetical protein
MWTSLGVVEGILIFDALVAAGFGVQEVRKRLRIRRARKAMNAYGRLDECDPLQSLQVTPKQRR